MPVFVRNAKASDAMAIATLHTAIWRETYKGLAPPEIRAKLNVAHRLNAWEKHLNTPNSQHHVLVATQSDTIVGFSFFGPATNPVFGTRAEIKHLYVDGNCQNGGVGTQLLHESFKQLFADGFTGAALATAKGNDVALTFYQAKGGRKIGHFIDAGPIWKSENVIVAWDNLPDWDL